ncbi:hypothetical protein [Paenibacillus sp. N3.4]|uniref:hypothetical protein n=1 Tax=Paenibacillus sp. N3.4 TaxID=2603222 RepID=UPI0011CC9B18|nr:hypothetical protein [Paenibacillus sp. N3.4]TXK76608.1 hypothetical protein FU659_25135 [Paenibacillus sp. N3.4]
MNQKSADDFLPLSHFPILTHVHTASQMTLVLLFAVTLTWLLSQEWVRRFSRPLIEPNLSLNAKLPLKKEVRE